MSVFSLNVNAGIENEKRVALVIGNGKYENVPSLPNAKNDSRLIKRSLESINFDVVYLEDASAKNVDKKARIFSEKLKSADIGLFYYSGHAIQFEGNNYLIPTDLPKDSDEVSAKYNAVNVNLIVDRMKKANNPTNIIILDACRDNPFAASSRSMTRGLAPINASAKGMFFAYSTSPGDVATDGTGSNSPFTIALSKYIVKPGITIHDVFTDVKVDVSRETNDKQRPWTTDSLLGKFYFAGTTTAKDSEIERLKKELELAKQAASLPKNNNQISNTQKNNVTNVNLQNSNASNIRNAETLKQLLELPVKKTQESKSETQTATVVKLPNQEEKIRSMNKECMNKFDKNSARSNKAAIKCFSGMLEKYPDEQEALKNLAIIVKFYEDKISSELLRKKYRAAKKSIAILKSVDQEKANEYQREMEEQKKSTKSKLKVIGAF